MSYWPQGANIKDLVGKTILEIVNSGDEIDFLCSDGTKYKMYHDQNCCESVAVEEIIGDFNDIIGNPILIAEERTSDENPVGVEKGFQESFTWTFYEIATIKGSVTIRWYGESNGHYSESVDFVMINNGKDVKND